jgi:hypothetical protein
MTKSKIIIIILALALICTIGTSIYFYNKYSQINVNPQQVAQEQAASIVKMVGDLIVLPQGETPSLMKITDPTKLKGQPFFDNSKIGDYILLYYNAKEAILYDPTANKIVDVGPFNVNNTPASSTSTSS